MRPLFVCRTEKTKLMLHVARGLEDRGELEAAYAFVAYYDRWRQVLEADRSIHFEGIFGTAEIFADLEDHAADPDELRRLDLAYGDETLWNVVFCEAHLVNHAHPKYIGYHAYSREQLLLYVQKTFQYVERIFDENDIDCVIDFARVGIFRRALDIVAKTREIPFYYPHTAVLRDLEEGDRFVIGRRGLGTYDFLDPRYNELLRNPQEIGIGWKYLDHLREGTTVAYSTWRGADEEHSGKQRRTPLRAVRTILEESKRLARRSVGEARLRIRARRRPELRYNFQLYKNLPSSTIPRGLLAYIRGTYARRFARYHTGPVEGRYAFMTLHVQPEASTSMRAPFQVNQLAVVENVSRCLPLDWKLVVKPNKRMIGLDPIAFLRRLQRIPNVVLVDHFADTPSLLEQATAVVTIAGTSGFEGALLGKRVILLGDKAVPWHRLRNVVHLTDWHQLHRAFREAEDFESDDVSLAAYLQSVHENSFPLAKAYTWRGPYDLSHQGYRNAVSLIVDNILSVHEVRAACQGS